MANDIENTINIFRQVTKALKNALDSGDAQIKIGYKKFNLELNSEDHWFRDIPEDVFEQIANEIPSLLVTILNKEDENSLENAAKENKQQEALLREKIDIIKNELIDEDLQKQFDFYGSCAGNILYNFNAQKIKRTTGPQEEYVDSVLINISTKDNINETKDKIQLELRPEQVDNIIDILKDVRDST